MTDEQIFDRVGEMTEPGSVSAHLEADLREQARQHGILVWLDKEGIYSCSRSRSRPAVSPATSPGRSSRVSRG